MPNFRPFLVFWAYFVLFLVCDPQIHSKTFRIVYAGFSAVLEKKNFTACFATVTDRSAMRGRMGARKQLSSCGWLELSKVGKDYESAAEGRECFLKEVRKDK